MPRRRRNIPSSTACSSIARPLGLLATFAASLAALTGAGIVASAGSGNAIAVKNLSVAPRPAFTGGRKPATLRYSFRGSAGEPRPIAVRVVRVAPRQTVLRWRRSGARPDQIYRRPWNGFRPNGRSAPDDLYAFQVVAPGQAPVPGGRFRLFNFRFPINGAHGTRGAIGEFGAPRIGERRHQGFDVTAPCGTPLLAVRAGEVERRGFDSDLYGNFIEIDARDSGLDYFYAHMQEPARAARGELVKTGERLGRVGLTGNADGTPCHLHIELRASGQLFDPRPALEKWDRYS